MNAKLKTFTDTYKPQETTQTHTATLQGTQTTAVQGTTKETPKGTQTEILRAILCNFFQESVKFQQWILVAETMTLRINLTAAFIPEPEASSCLVILLSSRSSARRHLYHLRQSVALLISDDTTNFFFYLHVGEVAFGNLLQAPVTLQLCCKPFTLHILNSCLQAPVSSCFTPVI